MISVIVPVILLLSIILIKKIPYIGGNIQLGLVAAGFSALILGGIYSPIQWGVAFVNGVDKLAWVIALSVFGSIYAQTQIKLGTMETVLNSLRSKFGRSPKGLVVTIMVSLAISGSLLGDGIAVATVIGILVIGVLVEIQLKPEQISALIVMGAGIGAIMPPIAQSFYMSSALMGLESADPVINIGYFTVGFILIACSFYATIFVKIKQLPEELIPKEKAFQIVKKGWKTLIPLMVLIVIVVLRSGFKIELLDLLNFIFKPISGILILKGLNFPIVKALLVCIGVSYLFKKVRGSGLVPIKDGFKNVKNTALIQVCAGFMVGSFYLAGQIEIVKEFAVGLSSNMLKLGGSAAMVFIGMLTGSQSTAQTAIFTFFGPALESIGVNPVHAAVGGAHVAMAGQGLPPACLTTFVVAGLVGGYLNKKVDPTVSMLYSSVMCVLFLAVGLVFFYI
jgi:TRAP-type transport system large permease protein